MLKRPENAWKYYHQLLPMIAQKTAGAERYKAEPYVYSSNIFGPESDKFGLANVSWLTGTAACGYLAATQYILGIRPTWDGLEIDPMGCRSSCSRQRSPACSAAAGMRSPLRKTKSCFSRMWTEESS